MSVRVRFWGTRGSLPAPLDARGVATKVGLALREYRDALSPVQTDAEIDAFVAGLPLAVSGTYGGNTSCVQLDCGSPEFTLCDAGSGLRTFGADVAEHESRRTPHVYNLFVSHGHWDHIMGFPFFGPAYLPENTIRIHGCHPDLRAAFERQHGAPSFPIAFGDLAATIEFVTLEPGRTYAIGGFDVVATAQHHPGVSYGYRFSTSDATVAYATDAEHAFGTSDDTAFAELFRDADVVVFDAMYTLGESVSSKETWGHSSNVVGVELARKAGARHLVLFHHDPANDDHAIEKRLRDARRFEEITRVGPALRVSAAYDGLELTVPDRAW